MTQDTDSLTQCSQTQEKVATLPKCIKKDVLDAGQKGESRPSNGDDCMVHYVARFEDDGEEFSSSRADGKPIVFTLGAGHVIKGWDMAVATMVRGEVSKFTCPADYAYGKDGLPPDVPEDAVIILELQLINWRSENDLFGDGGCIRTKLQDGSGTLEPEEGSEVLCSVKASASDGRILEERCSLHYIVGDRSLGPLARVVSRALEDMTKGSSVSLKCWPQYAYEDESHGDVTLELALIEVYQVNDVSPRKDESVMKKTIEEGVGHQTPLDGSTVRLMVESATDASGEVLSSFAGQMTFQITAGNGDVCDALEYAVATMRQAECAIVCCSNPEWCMDSQLGLSREDVNEGLSLKVKLLELDQCEPSTDMSAEERLAFAAQRKEVGSKLFKAQRYSLALERYKFVIVYLQCYVGRSDNAKEMVRVCELNRAACLLKLGDNTGARDSCTEVLKVNPGNVKALYRRACAHLELKDNAEAAKDLRRLLEQDPENKEAQRLLHQAVKAKKHDDKNTGAMLTGMNKAFDGFANAEENRVKEQKAAQAAKEAREREENKEYAEKWQKYLDDKRRGVPQSVEDTAKEMQRAKEAVS